ncbi:DUF3592 domain-containing protein [Ralstonia holmesii]|uniref:DUF3592 domain-containing protein n=1 Tax=Ralstonia holmesii TaxID=3058602 RepID=UPI0028F5AE6B|nr:DUF3592 domain-containing protein [Ralstonia sp. LMG 32967]CAJ0704830.1 hypothetical protein R11007_04431 [Ralstonia sp. LMG 32967]
MIWAITAEKKIAMKILKILGGVFLVVGLVLLGVGVVLWRSDMVFAEHALKTQGTVSELVWRESSDSKKRKDAGVYVPVVEFLTQEGRHVRITGLSGSNPPAYEEGDTVTVLYDPASPKDAVIDSFGERGAGPLILNTLGAVFALIGGSVLAMLWRRRKQRAWLAQHGAPIEAQLTGADLDTSMAVNGRNPWRLFAQWLNPTTQTVYEFQSDPIWFDPSPYVQRETVSVVINANNPKQYVMDISFLPKKA